MDEESVAAAISEGATKGLRGLGLSSKNIDETVFAVF
jgi:hypothetical protein